MWKVELAPEFEPELRAFPTDVRVELLAQARVVEAFGPAAKRPRVDTLNGSKHSNMKELRFDAANGVWRVAFAFDPERRAVLLVAGDKGGSSERAFYRRLIAIADRRFDAHLERLKALRARK
ncbi:MAG TPA: type II toxin-antitoxin system RelE/ParE family toxin [Stellaceae bacterium]|nr:type II toxin-antitoxin system RelE/ParE family toxin [Stellaceae bacterium]